jgi:hypothetical protein
MFQNKNEIIEGNFFFDNFILTFFSNIKNYYINHQMLFEWLL